jgi:two-component system cell cycle response regulator
MGEVEAGTLGRLSGGGTLKILVADDNAIARMLLERLLPQWGHEVVLACEGKQAWELLQGDDAPRLAVLDWMMPGMSGPELCSKMRKRVGRPYAYLLLVTSREEKQDVVSGLQAGADDYLTKPFYPQELNARLRVGVRILELEDKLVAAHEVAQFRATHDELTRLSNRASIVDTLRRELARSQRDGGSCGVLLGDLDHFKAVNDTLGHGAGDSVLCEAAARLAAGIRPYDSVGRYGGEEFLVVLPGCDTPNLLACAEHLLQAFRGSQFVTPEGTLSVTISLGAATSTGASGMTADALVRAADKALYQAKGNGRNRVEMAQEVVITQLQVAQTVMP